jgi:hypothetical protein
MVLEYLQFGLPIAHSYYSWKEYERGTCLDIFLFDHFDIFIFPSVTTFEEHVCGHSSSNYVHCHPFHILIVVQNIAYDKKIIIFLFKPQ